MEQKITALVAEMTLKEKALLCTGHDFWTTNAIERLGIPAIFMTDGPHGLRKATEGAFGGTVPATCFPTASALASSWNKRLLSEVGEAIGTEAQANNVQVVLGPGVNMKRSPLAGRNFEYFSEDPILSGELAASYINGVQHTGVGTSLKHFAANNQEFERMASDSVLDERTLHETYLKAFAIAVRKGHPWSVMSAYNKINGEYASQNYKLLTETLRNDWGYEGIVVSDWGAVHDIVESIRGGLQLEMPGNPTSPAKLIAAVEEGILAEEDLDVSVSKLLKAILQVYDSKTPTATYDKSVHHELARRAAAESIVLLKNKGKLLPFTPKQRLKVAVIGSFAKQPRYQGAGSSQVNPTFLTNAYDAFIETYGESSVLYSEGYQEDGSTSPSLLKHATETAQKAHIVFIFTGLPASYESEGFDRSHLDMPEGHNQLVEAIADVKKETAVVLMNGAAVTMPWEKKVGSIIEGWLGGQAGGQAIVDIISGAITPSGKLSETFPQRIEDTPPYPDYPARGKTAVYREGILIGYKHYDSHGIQPLFPFGYGLSYTQFAYSDLILSSHDVNDDEELTVQLTLKNTGKYDGKEIVQLYITDHTRSVLHPPKELRSFQKVSLKHGETTQVTFTLKPEHFSYYDPHSHSWRVDQGRFTIRVGGSSQDLPLESDIEIAVPQKHMPQITRDSLLKEFAHHPRGKRFYNLIVKQAHAQMGNVGNDILLEHVINDLPLSKLGMFAGGAVSDQLIDAIVLYCQHSGSLNPVYTLPLIKEASKLAFRRALKR